jgi:hypothetical protein
MGEEAPESEPHAGSTPTILALAGWMVVLAAVTTLSRSLRSVPSLDEAPPSATLTAEA